MKLYYMVHRVPGKQERYVEADAGEVVCAFRELPQTTQMRAAADVLVDATDRHFHIRGDAECQDWRPANLRMMATRWDREDAEKAKQANEIEELAQALAKSAGYATPDSMAYKRAQDLYGWGWRKQATDE